MSENDKIWLNEHLEYARTLPTYNEAFPMFEMIYRHFGATPWFHEIIREVDKVKLLFRNGDSSYRGMPATPNNMPPAVASEYSQNSYIQKAIKRGILNKNEKPKTTKRNKIPNTKPMTLKYYVHGYKGALREQQRRVSLVFRKFGEWKWIDKNTCSEDFDAFFEGDPRHCNIAWIANTTILTILLHELIQQDYIQPQTGLSAKSLVEKQFGKTPNSDRKRLDSTSDERIKLTCLILDVNNPLPEARRGDSEENYDASDAALQTIYTGLLHSTKGI